MFWRYGILFLQTIFSQLISISSESDTNYYVGDVFMFAIQSW